MARFFEVDRSNESKPTVPQRSAGANLMGEVQAGSRDCSIERLLQAIFTVEATVLVAKWTQVAVNLVVPPNVILSARMDYYFRRKTIKQVYATILENWVVIKQEKATLKSLINSLERVSDFTFAVDSLRQLGKEIIQERSMNSSGKLKRSRSCETFCWTYGERGLSVISSTFQSYLPEILHGLSKKYGQNAQLLLLYIVRGLGAHDYCQDDSTDIHSPSRKQARESEQGFPMRRASSETKMWRSHGSPSLREAVVSRFLPKMKISDSGCSSHAQDGIRTYFGSIMSHILYTLVFFGIISILTVYLSSPCSTCALIETETGGSQSGSGRRIPTRIRNAIESHEFTKVFDQFRPDIDQESCMLRGIYPSFSNVQTDLELFVDSVEHYEQKMRTIPKHFKLTLIISRSGTTKWEFQTKREMIKLSNSNSIRKLIVQQNIGVDSLARTIEQFENLKSLDLDGEFGKEICLNCGTEKTSRVTHSNLETLKIVDFHVTTAQFLKQLFLPKLKIIIFKKTNISHEIGDNIRDFLVRHRESLLGVHFFDCHFQEAVLHKVDNMEPFPKLKSFILNGATFLNQAISNSFQPGNICRIFPNLQIFVANSVFNNMFRVSNTCKSLKDLHVGFRMESKSKSINFSFIQGLLKSPNLPKLNNLIFSLFSQKFSLFKQFHFLDIRSGSIDLRQSECYKGV